MALDPQNKSITEDIKLEPLQHIPRAELAPLPNDTDEMAGVLRGIKQNMVNRIHHIQHHSTILRLRVEDIKERIRLMDIDHKHKRTLIMDVQSIINQIDHDNYDHALTLYDRLAQDIMTALNHVIVEKDPFFLSDRQHEAYYTVINLAHDILDPQITRSIVVRATVLGGKGVIGITCPVGLSQYLSSIFGTSIADVRIIITEDESLEYENPDESMNSGWVVDGDLPLYEMPIPSPGQTPGQNAGESEVIEDVDYIPQPNLGKIPLPSMQIKPVELPKTPTGWNDVQESQITRELDEIDANLTDDYSRQHHLDTYEIAQATLDREFPVGHRVSCLMAYQDRVGIIRVLCNQGLGRRVRELLGESINGYEVVISEGMIINSQTLSPSATPPSTSD